MPRPPTSLSAAEKRARMRVSIDAPASMFSETLRNAKIAFDVVMEGQGSRVIGVISVLPGEGKSTVAANLAGLLAANGVEDAADRRRPAQSRPQPQPWHGSRARPDGSGGQRPDLAVRRQDRPADEAGDHPGRAARPILAHQRASVVGRNATLHRQRQGDVRIHHRRSAAARPGGRRQGLRSACRRFRARHRMGAHAARHGAVAAGIRNPMSPTRSSASS